MILDSRYLILNQPAARIKHQVSFSSTNALKKMAHLRYEKLYSLWVRISVLLSFLRMQESPNLQTIKRCLYAQAWHEKTIRNEYMFFTRTQFRKFYHILNRKTVLGSYGNQFHRHLVRIHKWNDLPAMRQQSLVDNF